MKTMTISTDSRPVRIPLVALAVLGYAVFLRLCYCLLVHGTVLLYGGWKEEIIYHVANILPMAAMAGGCACIVFLVTDRGVLRERFFLKSCVDAVLTFILTWAGYFALLAIYRLFHQSWNVDYGGIIVIFLVTWLLTECFYYMIRSRRELKKAEYQKLRAVQYQFDPFRAQVNPHFLFNSLNMLMDIIETDTKKAGRFTEALSDIYRYVLQTHSKSSVCLSDEMAFLESYLHILGLKYNNFLSVRMEVSADCGKKRIVPFTMQLLIENVTKHNVISEKYPMEVKIDINEENIIIANRITRKKNGVSSGLGLKYLQSQYEAAGKVFSVTDDGEYFTASVPYV